MRTFPNLKQENLNLLTSMNNLPYPPDNQQVSSMNEVFTMLDYLQKFKILNRRI